jgi:4-amino-4-deoxy-L-arabinose transferase-like glycosyltransferase
MIDILVLSAIVLIVWALGKKLFHSFAVKFDSLLEEFIFSVALGFGLLAYCTLALGLLGLLYPWVFYASLTVLSIALFSQIKALFFITISRLVKFRKINWPGFALFLIVILFAHILLNFICALSPLTFWDAAIYHLAAVKIYIQNHQIIPIPDMFESNFPFTMEMLFMLGILIRGEILANLLHCFISILSILTIYCFCRKYLCPRIGLLAAAIFYATPAVNSNVGQALGDMGLVFCALLAIYAFFDWLDNSKNNRLLLAAIFSGICSGIKHSGLIISFLLISGMMFKMFFVEREKVAIIFKNIFLFTIILLAIVSPWYLKSYIYTGNPLFPFFYEFFLGAKMANPTIMVGTSSSTLHSVKDIVLFPWNFNMQLQRFGGWSHAYGPLYLMFIPCLWALTKIERRIKYLLIYSLGYIGVWMFMSAQNNRHFLPCFALLSIVVTYAIDRLTAQDKFMRQIILAAVGMILCVNLLLLLGQTYFRIPAALGLQSREDFLSKRVNSYEAIEYINHNLSDSEKVLLLEPRGYYCDRPYIRGGPQFQTIIDYTSFANSGQMLNRLRQLKITHILLNKALMEEYLMHIDRRLRGAYAALLRLNQEGVLKEELKLIYSKNDTYLYEINYNIKE